MILVIARGGCKSICMLFPGFSVLKVIVFDPFNLFVPGKNSTCKW